MNRIMEREQKFSVNFENLLETFQAWKEVDNHRTIKRKKTLRSSLLVANVILCIVTVALGTLVIVLKSDMTVLKNDMTELQNLRGHIATVDHANRVSGVENKCEDIKKEKEAIKREIDQLKADLETLKIEPKNETKNMKNNPRNYKRWPHKSVAKANKEELLLKKMSTKKILLRYFTSHESRTARKAVFLLKPTARMSKRRDYETRG